MNYKHLHYFWVVAQEGTIAAACKRLHLTPQTVSAQLQLLEGALGQELFERSGRRLKLTESGRLAYGYADSIFRLGNEMVAQLRAGERSPEKVFQVGITDVVPKLVAYQLLEPVYALQQPAIKLICREGKLEPLLADLALHKLDLVLADNPLPPGLGIRAFNHTLGESGASFLATREQMVRFGEPFPQCMEGAPMLIPTRESAMATNLDSWFESINVIPRIVGEFDDSALLNAFGQGGHGIVVCPTVNEAEVCNQHGLEVLGRTEEVRESYYAITTERRTRHPGIVAVIEGAASRLRPG